MKAKPTATQTNRRTFLAHALAAGAGLALPRVVSAAALGRGGAVAPSERIVMGAIGVGGRGASDLGWTLGEPDVQFVAVADVIKARRDQAKNSVDGRYGNRDCAAYRDFRELLAERTDIDAVLIATGDRWHAHVSVLAMRAGKDVYCEKPSCFTMAQGRRIVETARRYQRVFQTGTQRLSEPHHVFAIEAARSGRLGPVHTAYADIRFRGGARRDWLPEEPAPPRDEMDWDLWLGPAPWRPYNAAYRSNAWYNFHELATDAAMWGAHTIAQALAGIDPAAQDGVLEIEYDAARPDLVVHFAGGLKLVLVRGGDCWAPCAYWRGSCGERFDGPEGWVAAADGYSKPDVSSPALLGDYRKVMGEYAARTQRPMNHVRDFLNCVKSRRPAVADPVVMSRSMTLALAADICTELKRGLKLDLAKGEFAGDVEANRLRSRAAREPWEG